MTSVSASMERIQYSDSKVMNASEAYHAAVSSDRLWSECHNSPGHTICGWQNLGQVELQPS